MNSFTGFLFVIWTFAWTGCNLEVNTVDPQASSSINESKNQKVFLKQYNVLSKDTSCLVNEAWVEYAWKNELDDSKKIRKELGGTQLVLNLDLQKLPVEINGYLISWELIESTYGKFGSSNGVFVLNLKGQVHPNKFQIYLRGRNAKKEEMCVINLSEAL